MGLVGKVPLCSISENFKNDPTIIFCKSEEMQQLSHWAIFPQNFETDKLNFFLLQKRY